jgi:ATP-dependent protease Clp ATPase subunit
MPRDARWVLATGDSQEANPLPYNKAMQISNEHMPDEHKTLEQRIAELINRTKFLFAADRLPGLAKMRNVGEHIDDYVIGAADQKMFNVVIYKSYLGCHRF